MAWRWNSDGSYMHMREECDGEELAAAPAKMLRHLLNGVGPEAITLLIAARDAYIAEL